MLPTLPDRSFLNPISTIRVYTIPAELIVPTFCVIVPPLLYARTEPFGRELKRAEFGWNCPPDPLTVQPVNEPTLNVQPVPHELTKGGEGLSNEGFVSETSAAEALEAVNKRHTNNTAPDHVRSCIFVNPRFNCDSISAMVLNFLPYFVKANVPDYTTRIPKGYAD